VRPYVSILGFDKDTNELVGIVVARLPVKAAEQGQLNDIDLEGYIATLGVRPGFRGKGLGRILLKKMIALLRSEVSESLDISLHVKADNANAIKMYLACGFYVTEDIKSHYYIEGQHHDAFKLVNSTRFTTKPIVKIRNAKEEDQSTRCPIL